MRVLGISCLYHDSAAALIEDGEIIAAAQEERFTRVKHDAAHPTHAINYCLKEAGCDLSQVDYVAFYEKPFQKFERLLETYFAFAPRGFESFRTSMPVWFKDKLFQKEQLIKTFKANHPTFLADKRLLFSEHHLSHAASSFYPSPFADAAVLTMDGVGEWTTTSLAYGHGNKIDILKEIHFPHSLGLLYSAFTYFLGFKVNSGEYKVMGLAPYGSPKYTKPVFDHILDVKSDGSFRLNQDYFDYCTGLTMTNDKFAALFGMKRRTADEPLTQIHMDMAATVQAVTEEVVLRLCRSAAKETKSKNLCLAGGVALNCVANGKVQKEGIFESIWIQPAAGDAGGALGAALAAYYSKAKSPAPRKTGGQDAMKGSYLGPSFSTEEVCDRLTKVGARYVRLERKELVARCVDALANGKALGWFQSRMEFGPRALGSRSIVADARSPKMQSVLNLKVKFRESFRPFAPMVLREDLSEWFDLDCDSPYMLLVAPVKKEKQKPMTADQEKLFGIEKLNIERSEIPAVTHVDYSARVQTVDREVAPWLHNLISGFKEKTGCPVLVNTSFNVRGEPIVGSPEDAFRCFMGTDLDVLAIEDVLLLKEDQNAALAEDYKSKFELD